MAGMDGRDITFSNNLVNDLDNGSFMESFFEENLRDTAHACTHTHTCNPPGMDNSQGSKLIHKDLP
jgi:hypothetical protein